MSTFEDEGNAWVFHLSEITQHLGTTYQLYIMKKKIIIFNVFHWILILFF